MPPKRQETTCPPQVLVWLSSLMAGQGLPAPKAKARASRGSASSTTAYTPGQTASAADTVITYGKKHYGKTYGTVLRDVGYVKWCLQQASGNSSEDFQDFVAYASRHYRLEGGVLQQTGELPPDQEQRPVMTRGRQSATRAPTPPMTITSALDFLFAQDPRELESIAQIELNDDAAFLEDGEPGSETSTRIRVLEMIHGHLMYNM